MAEQQPPITEQPALSGDELARANFERAVGEVLLLLGAHPLYEQLFLAEIKERILPPMALRQFRVARDKDGNTVGYVSWAFVNEEVDARLKKAVEGLKAGRLSEAPKITKEEWKCGELFLIMDSVGVSLEDSKRLAEKIEEEILDKK